MDRSVRGARFEAERTHGSILDALDAATARERFGAADARARAKLIEACAETFADPATVEARRDAGRDDEFDDVELDRYVRYTRYTNTSGREGDERATRTTRTTNASRLGLSR